MKTRQIVIAVTGIGAPLGQSIVRAALSSTRKYRIIGLDLHDEDQIIFPEIEFHKLVHINSIDYKRCLISFLKKNSVQLLFLGSEREMLGVLQFRDSVESETNVKLALSDKRALTIGMDKLRTVKLLQDNGLPYPHTQLLSKDWEDVKQFAEKIGYPCIIKGKRSGTPIIVRNADDLWYCHCSYPNAIVQEFLGSDDSREYTVGVFHTKEYGVIDTYCMVRQLKYGLTWRGWYEPNPAIENMAAKAVSALSPCGSVNVQLREHKGQPVIHEFNVRCSSTTVFRALSGWNEIDMAVDYFLFNKKPEIPSKITPGTAVRFFQETWLESFGNAK